MAGILAGSLYDRHRLPYRDDHRTGLGQEGYSASRNHLRGRLLFIARGSRISWGLLSSELKRGLLDGQKDLISAHVPIRSISFQHTKDEESPNHKPLQQCMYCTCKAMPKWFSTVVAKYSRSRAIEVSASGFCRSPLSISTWRRWQTA